MTDPTWTYSGGTVISEDLDLVRLRIGDTNSADPLLYDEEINVYLTAWPDNVDFAAAGCCEAIAAKYARDFNFAADGQSFNRRERVEHYMNLAASFRRSGYLIWPNDDTDDDGDDDDS